MELGRVDQVFDARLGRHVLVEMLLGSRFGSRVLLLRLSWNEGSPRKKRAIHNGSLRIEEGVVRLLHLIRLGLVLLHEIGNGLVFFLLLLLHHLVVVHGVGLSLLLLRFRVLALEQQVARPLALLDYSDRLGLFLEHLPLVES